MYNLCKLYALSYQNQKIDVDKNSPFLCFNARIKNLDRQYPYDMREMCKFYGIEL